MASRQETGRRLDLAGANEERARRTVDAEEAAQERAEGQQGAAVRSLQPAPHFSHTPGRVGLRRLDSGADRWPQFDRDVEQVRASLRGQGIRRNGALGWAQNWAQQGKHQSTTRLTTGTSCCYFKGLMVGSAGLEPATSCL